MTGLIVKGFVAGDFLLQKIQAKFTRFSREENGATAVEYALLIGLIAIAIFAAVLALGGGLKTAIGTATCAIKGKGVASTAADGTVTCAA